MEISVYFTFWPYPKVTNLTLGWKCYLYSVPLVIPVNLICYMTMFEKKINFDPLGRPSAHKSHPQAWSRHQNKNSVRYVLYILFVRTHTRFGRTKIFEIDFVVGIQGYWTFDITQGHQLDHRVNFLLVFSSSHHHRQFDMLHNHPPHPPKKLTPPPAEPGTSGTQSPPLRHDPGDRMKIPSDMICIFHLWEHTQNLFLKLTL